MPVFIAIPCSLVMPATVHTTVCHCTPPSVMIGLIIKSRPIRAHFIPSLKLNTTNSYTLAGGSLRSPPTRNTAKYCIYIIISSDCLASGSLALLGSLSAPESNLKSVQNEFVFTAGARSGIFFSWVDFICRDG